MKQMPLLLVMSIAALCIASCSTPSSSYSIYAQHINRLDQQVRSVSTKVRREDGYLISSREFGVENKGPTIIVMHGFPDNQHLYDEIIPILARQHHVISFDFLGWGESDKPTGHLYSVASQRADLDAIVRHFKLTSVVVIAHDLSGQVGIDWALENQNSTAALVLLNTYYQDMPTLKAPEAIETFSTPGIKRDVIVWAASRSPVRFKGGVGSQLAKFFSNPIMREAYIPILTHQADTSFPAFVSSTSVLWREIGARRARLPEMLAFQKPVWIIFGADDPYLNTGVAAGFSASFPNSQMHLIPRAGHYVQLDAAPVVAGIIETNLASLTAP